MKLNVISSSEASIFTRDGHKVLWFLDDMMGYFTLSRYHTPDKNIYEFNIFKSFYETHFLKNKFFKFDKEINPGIYSLMFDDENKWYFIK